jgi:hypothetical protein
MFLQRQRRHLNTMRRAGMKSSVNDQGGQPVSSFVHSSILARSQSYRLRRINLYRYTVRSYSIFNIPMYGKVKRLRERGRRMSNREIGQAPHVEGELTLAMLRSTYVLEVRPRNSQVGPGLLPELYEARLVAMHTGGMLFRGEERPQGDDGPAYVQEWSVMVEPR